MRIRAKVLLAGKSESELMTACDSVGVCVFILKDEPAWDG